MAMEIEGSFFALASDQTLSDIRATSLRCKERLHNLSNDHSADAADTAEAAEQMANFKLWAAELGVFGEGRQSMAQCLTGVPHISTLVGQLLVDLEYRLETVLQPDGQEEVYTDVQSDRSSDRSASPFRMFQPFGSDNTPPKAQSNHWTPVQDTMADLRSLAITIPIIAGQHYQKQIVRFRSLARNEELYKQVESCARQKVDHLFPNAKTILRERMAESIATRRIRFLCIEHHQKKNSTIHESVLVLQQKSSKPMEDHNAQTAAAADDDDDSNVDDSDGDDERNKLAVSIPTVKHDLNSSTHPTTISPTTEFNPLYEKNLQQTQKKIAKSVSSEKIFAGRHPKEASGSGQWM
ncbi:hypothetical protein V8C35DRAFT_284694 [Trichoderma chlorosporum]